MLGTRSLPTSCRLGGSMNGQTRDRQADDLRILGLWVRSATPGERETARIAGLVSTPSRIRTGDLLRESSETHEAAISSYAGLLDLSPRPLPLGRFAGLCGSFPGVLAATGGPRPNPRAWTRPFGDHSPSRPTRTRGDGGRDGFRRAPTLDASYVVDHLEHAHALTGHGGTWRRRRVGQGDRPAVGVHARVGVHVAIAGAGARICDCGRDRSAATARET